MQSRFLAAIFVVMLFLPLNAEAKIISRYDPFDGSNTISSLAAKVDFFDQTFFTKLIPREQNADGSYLLTFTKISSKDWHYFSDTGSTITIDGETTKLITFDTKHEIKQGYSYLNLITNATFDMTTLTDKLKTAKTVTFRIHFNNRPFVDLVIPEKILREWKQVISMEH